MRRGLRGACWVGSVPWLVLAAACGAFDSQDVRSPDDAEPGETIGRVRPLGEPLELAFKSGYDGSEQLWLRGASGTLRRIDTWPIDPRWESSCCCVRSTGGYPEGGGRFASWLVDDDGQHVVIVEQLACEPEDDSFPVRVLVQEVATGLTRLVARLPRTPEVLSTKEGIFLLVERRQNDSLGGLDAYELRDGALEPIPVPVSKVAFWTGQGLRAARFQDLRLLLVPGAPPLEDDGDGFEVSTRFDAFQGRALDAFDASPSGERLCLVTHDPSGALPVVQRVSVLQPDGSWLESDGARSAGGCVFSPDERHVLAGTSVFDLDADALTLAGETFPITATWNDRAFAVTNDVPTSISELDWERLALVPFVAPGAAPDLCGGTEGTRLVPFFPPDDRPLAIVKHACGCIDCDISGSFALRTDDLEITAIEVAAGEHDVYDVAFPPSGGAVVASAQRMGGSSEDSETDVVPPPGTFFSIDEDGAVRTEGPFDDVQGVIHGLQAPGAAGR